MWKQRQRQRWAVREAAWTEMAEVTGKCNVVTTLATSLTMFSLQREEVKILYTYKS